MAEAILREELRRIRRTDILVTSMGIEAGTGIAPATGAIEACARHNIDISGQRSRPVSLIEMKQTDFIFGMEKAHTYFLRDFFPVIADRVYLLGAWPGKEFQKSQIKDPMGGSSADFEKTYTIITTHICRILPLLLLECPLKVS
jgi:protein-tyrosine-phosphatase